MATGSVLAFWIVALLLIVVPGADWAFTIGAGVRGCSVGAAVGGLVAGYAAITLVVAGGVGVAVAGSPGVLTGLTLVGGAYLVWHGATTLARPSEPVVPEEGVAGERGRVTFLRGVGVSGLNPKGLLIFLALLPQFTDPAGGWPVAGQIGVLGAAFTLTCAVFYLALGSLSRAVLLRRPGAARWAGRLSGAAMIGIGGWLVLERLLS